MTKSLNQLFEKKYGFDPKEKGVNIDEVVAENFSSLENYLEVFDEGDNEVLLHRALTTVMVMEQFIFPKEKRVKEGFEQIFPNIRFLEHEGQLAFVLEKEIETLYFANEKEDGEGFRFRNEWGEDSLKSIVFHTHMGFYKIEKLHLARHEFYFGVHSTMDSDGTVSLEEDTHDEKRIMKTDILKETDNEIEFIIRSAYIDEKWDWDELISRTFEKSARRYRYWVEDGKFNFEIEEDVKQDWLFQIKSEKDFVKHPHNTSIWSLLTTPEKYAGSFLFVDALDNFYVKVSDVWIKTEKNWFEEIVDNFPEAKKEYEEYLNSI